MAASILAPLADPDTEEYAGFRALCSASADEEHGSVSVDLRKKRSGYADDDEEEDDDDEDDDDDDDDDVEEEDDGGGLVGYGDIRRFARREEHVVIIKKRHHQFNDDDNADRTDCLSSDGDGDEDEEQQEEELSSPFALRSSLSDLFEREVFYMPRPDFSFKLQSGDIIDPSSRQRAIIWLLKAQAFFKFSVHTVALAINYLDRFLSRSSAVNGKAWMMQLLSVACLSLAAKMEEIEVPLLQDLQVDAEFIFEPCTIQRMELLVLSTLGWRMSSVTAFSYTDFFLTRFDLPHHTKRALISRVNQLILTAIQDLRFLGYRPSSIAGAATLCAHEEMFPLHFKDQKTTILCMVPLQLQDELMDCHGLMMDIYVVKIVAIKDGMSECSAPRSPMGVLDASFSSTSMNSFVSSQRTQCISSTAPKRRRVDSNT